MNATAILTAPVDRVTGWFRRPASPPSDTGPSHHAIFAAMEKFLTDNGLDLTQEHLAFALAYSTQSDERLCAAADAVLRVRPTITARDIERITTDPTRVDPAATMLEELTRELEQKVGECIGAIGESFLSTSEYSKALDQAAADISASPAQTYNRLIALTLDVAETTRKISCRLETAHDYTRGLRADLDRALRVAEEDDLTGLFNRRGFMQKFEAAITDQPDRFRTVALCDIDNFKLVNDRHGHETGDRVLRYVAKQLRDNLDSKIMVGRYGGEEFVCLFEDVTPTAAATMLDKVRDALKQRTLRDQETGEAIGSITFSAGVACVGSDPVQALRSADTALYSAKGAGKDRIVAAT